MAWKVVDENGRLAPVIVYVVLIAAFLLGVGFGYWIRMQLESRAELSVVLDDEKEVQEIERQTEQDLKSHAALMEALRNVQVGECFKSSPLPDQWFDLVQPDVGEEI